MADLLNRVFENLGYQQLTTATVKTLTVPSGARVAMIGAEVGTVRWLDDGSTSPTASVGQRLLQDTDFLYNGKLQKLKFIEETSGAIINVSYYK